jgi:hypothetical protein
VQRYDNIFKSPNFYWIFVWLSGIFAIFATMSGVMAMIGLELCCQVDESAPGGASFLFIMINEETENKC